MRRDVVRPPASRHGPIAQLLLALAPLSSILVAYAVAQWLNATIEVGTAGAGHNRLGLPVHIDGPIDADRWVFGSVPTVWLQQRLVDGSTHWYDGLAALVYVTHFVAIPVVTVVIWFSQNDRFRAWVTAVIVFTVVGVGGYIAYPAAPPWLASEQGAIATVHRISDLGWSYLHLGPVGDLLGIGQSGSNPVAAMPSLHAGSAALVACFLWPRGSASWRPLLLVYTLLMGVTLVYTGEHYVADVLSGWATAGIAVAVSAVLTATGRAVPTAARADRRVGRTPGLQPGSHLDGVE